MSLEGLTQQILSDADTEAKAIISAANERAACIIAEAEASIAQAREAEEREISERTKAIAEGRAASARLDGKKIDLAERRRVIDTVYARAIESLVALPSEEGLKLFSSLLDAYAEEGDAVVLSRDCPFAAEAAEIIKRKNLTLSRERANIRGGFYLRGVKCDRDVSFEALLEADREIYQAELAKKLFRTL